MRPMPLAFATDAERFGGKAAQLAEAVAAGLPVPMGVALSADLVEALGEGEPVAEVAVREAFAAFDGPVAVRSSAVGEDSVTASFAGQHLTRLNVRTADALITAVQQIWDSGRTEGAIAYRRRLGLPDVWRMGVVVQALVEPDVAGVLFTVDPLTGADERVIEANWGLGEAVVSGLVTPDRFRLSRDGVVLERRPGLKDVAIRPLPDGGTSETTVPAPLVGRLCLDDKTLVRLHELALKCESVFSGPRDLEWAIVNGTVHLLQSRHVTGRPMGRSIG